MLVWSFFCLLLKCLWFRPPIFFSSFSKIFCVAKKIQCIFTCIYYFFWNYYVWLNSIRYLSTYPVKTVLTVNTLYYLCWKVNYRIYFCFSFGNHPNLNPYDLVPKYHYLLHFHFCFQLLHIHPLVPVVKVTSPKK